MSIITRGYGECSNLIISRGYGICQKILRVIKSLGKNKECLESIINQASHSLSRNVKIKSTKEDKNESISKSGNVHTSEKV